MVNILIQIYMYSVIISALIILYIRMRGETNLEFINKAMILLKYPVKREIKNPFCFVFVPVLNLVVSTFLLWFIRAKLEDIEKFFKDNYENEQ